MGFNASQGETRFRIPAANMPHVLGALKALALAAPAQGYRFVRTYEIRDAQTVEAHFRAWSFVPTFNEAGDIVNLRLDAEKVGDEPKLYAAIAPFVERGSFIVMHGEDHSTWRHLFKDSQCIEQEAGNWFGRDLPVDDVIDVEAREVREPLRLAV